MLRRGALRASDGPDGENAGPSGISRLPGFRVTDFALGGIARQTRCANAFHRFGSSAGRAGRSLPRPVLNAGFITDFRWHRHSRRRWVWAYQEQAGGSLLAAGPGGFRRRPFTSITSDLPSLLVIVCTLHGSVTSDITSMP